jgi:hypothetical protein
MASDVGGIAQKGAGRVGPPADQLRLALINPKGFK